ncbi:MAG: M48 family metallopeptidase [Candidatus Eisenbacteria bacterium]
MAMNFFEHQERARRNTSRLVLLFSFAVAGIVIALYVGSRIVLRYAFASSTGPYLYPWWDPGAFAGVAVAGSLFIGLASWSKSLSLRQGGGKVAEMLGGREVRPDTGDPDERRLRNVVEEIAIASGVPVPKVYLLDKEEGINAFAAGHTADDAAVAVTRGTLKTLSRAELQGVIAHEFSHILNGDMRLNIRLIGVLFGIFVMGIIGRILARVGGSGGRNRKGAPVIAIAGLMLMLIGFIGTLVGRMIQSAVSRQREFLADSSAVQFTRDPSGIAGALKKIGGFVHGSRVRSPQAEQVSHMFFALGLKPALFSGLFATHPPLDERIRRIDPSFDGRFPKRLPEGAEPFMPEPGAGVEGIIRGLREGAGISADPGEAMGRVGAPAGNDPLLGVALLGLVPAAVREMVGRPPGAAAAVSALFLDRDPGMREVQGRILAERDRAETVRSIENARALLEGLDPRARLVVADLAAPALRDLTPGERERFRERVGALVRADRAITLFEFTLSWVLERRMEREGRPPAPVRYRSLGPVLKDFAVLLGALAREGSAGDPEGARAAFDRGRNRVPGLGKIALPFDPAEKTNYQDVARALERLGEASYPVKEKVVTALAHTVLADRKVVPAEAELLRVVSIALDCPMPPFPALVASGAA